MVHAVLQPSKRTAWVHSPATSEPNSGEPRRLVGTRTGVSGRGSGGASRSQLWPTDAQRQCPRRDAQCRAGTRLIGLPAPDFVLIIETRVHVATSCQVRATSNHPPERTA